ncbi:unnamed protein product [Linum trigynum]|uniref:Peroxin-13 n=1 Tax=Linum trigynum TaxID=586398 RepID=A0AAV2E8K7_9ROSI
MAANSQPAGGGAPPKPWERAVPSASGPAPFKPPSAGSTSAVVEASGTAKPGEIVPPGNNNAVATTNRNQRPVPNRPWQPQTTQYGVGGYGMNNSYGIRGGYGSSLYGNNMYRGGYGGLYSGGGMYGGYGNQMGGGYGMNPYGQQQNPDDVPSPGFWISFLRVLAGVVNFFGRIAMLIDQNTQAFHMFMSALLQLFDRSGMLYGELARFALRMLGVKTPKKVEGAAAEGQQRQQQVQASKAAEGGWDNVWGAKNSS